MTMKTKKTLQHIAAVAAVLLALCLVFAAPVGAAEVTVSSAPELEDNITSAAAGTTIKFLADITGDVSVPEYKDGLVIDGNGKEMLGNLTLGVSSAGAVNSGSVTVKNIKFTNGYLYIRGYATVTVEGNTFTGSVGPIEDGSSNPASDQYAAITVPWSKDATIKGNTIKDALDGHTGGINLFGFTNVTISSNTIENTAGNSLTLTQGKTGGKIDITGNTMKNWAQRESKEGRALRVQFDLDATSSVTFNSNTMVHPNSKEEFVKMDRLSANPVASGNTINGIAVDGTDVGSAEYYIYSAAVIGSETYDSLDYAVDNATNGQTVTLLKDVNIANLVINKSLTLDGNGNKKLTGTVNLSSEAESIAVTLKDITVNGGTTYAVKVGTKANLIIDGANLTGYSAVYVSHRGQTNGEADGDGSTVTIQNSKLSSTNNAGVHETNSFGTVAIFANDTKIEISGSTLAAAAINNNQSIIRFGGSSEDANIKHTGSSVSIVNSVLDVQTAGKTSIYSVGTKEQGTLTLALGEGVTSNVNPSAYIAGGMEVVQPGDKYLVQKYVDRSSSSSSSVKPEEPEEPEEPEQPEEPVVEPETPAAPGEVASSTEVTDGGEVAFETTVVDDETGEQSAPAAADDEVKGVVLPTGTEGTVEFVPVSEQPAPAGQEENTKRVFEINVPSYKKGEASVIKFQMTVAEIEADGKTAADVALWHYDEETGEWTKLVTSFIIKDGIVYFEAITNDFSPFAIIYEDEPAGDLPTDTPETPEQPEEPASPAPVLAVLAALGAAVVLRRK